VATHFCVEGNKPSGSVKGEEFVKQLSCYQPVNQAVSFMELIINNF
jgi:hypothetical protein